MLWAITAYFNPARYRTRLNNFHTFRANLRAPLAVVELSLDTEFDLRREDADLLIQIPCGDPLWQKERLLNVALAALPAACTCVAWLDCDLIFDRDDWVCRAEQALARLAMIQLFEHMYDLPPGHHRPVPGAAGQQPPIECAVRQFQRAPADEETLRLRSGAAARLCGLGLAWAARRDILDAHGLYDACILGSGDRALLCAAVGRFNDCTAAIRMNARQVEHYLCWARRFHQAVDGRLGFLEGEIYHLWHGELHNRRYRERHEDFAAFGFDPFTDIVLGPGGAWQWSGTKPHLRQFFLNYFANRREDG